MPRSVCVICNPTAGGGRARRALDAVVERLRAGGLSVAVELSSSPEHVGVLARRAALEGCAVVSYGGDGTARLVVQALRGLDATVGLLPGGRGNDFARVLEIPRDPLAACEVLLAGVTRRVDVGEADGATFLGVASVGLESEVTDIANAMPRWLGEAAYGVSALVGLARWQPATFTLEFGDRPGDAGEPQAAGVDSFSGYMVAAANSGRFGGGMRIAPDASLEDGLLDVVLIEHGPRLRTIMQSPSIFRGTHIHASNVRVLRAAALKIDSDRPFAVYADGDQIARTPVNVRVIPRALRVLAPAP